MSSEKLLDWLQPFLFYIYFPLSLHYYYYFLSWSSLIQLQVTYGWTQNPFFLVKGLKWTKILQAIQVLCCLKKKKKKKKEKKNKERVWGQTKKLQTVKKKQASGDKQSAFIISKSMGLSEIFEISVSRHIRFAELRIKINRTTTFHKCICNLTPEVRDVLKILWKRGEIVAKYYGKEKKLLLWSNFSSFPYYLLPVVRFPC